MMMMMNVCFYAFYHQVAHFFWPAPMHGELGPYVIYMKETTPINLCCYYFPSVKKKLVPV